MAALTSSISSAFSTRSSAAFRCPSRVRRSVVANASPFKDIAQKRVEKLLSNNRTWAERQTKVNPGFFDRLKNQQNPEYLWIGCADSRVPANVIVGLDPGEVFVQRNVGNQASHTDINCMSCLEFSVKSLGVKTIIVCGHYNCGAVKASLTLPSKTPGLVNCWISDIREARNQNMKKLQGLSQEEQISKMCEYNVLRQVFNVCTSATVQEAWDKGSELNVYGLCYSLDNGILNHLVGPISSNKILGATDPEEFFNNVEESILDKILKSFSSMDDDEPPKKVDPAAANANEISKKLAEHAAWDLGAY